MARKLPRAPRHRPVRSKREAQGRVQLLQAELALEAELAQGTYRPRSVDEISETLFTPARELALGHPDSALAFQAARVLRAVASILIRQPTGSEAALSLAARSLNRALGIRANAKPGDFGRTAELLRDHVAAAIGQGEDAESIADGLAVLSIKDPGVRRVLQLTGSRIERANLLLPEIKFALPSPGAPCDRSAVAEQIVLDAARTAGFRRPSRLFGRLDKRAKRAR